MHVHACALRKGVGGIVGRMGDVGRCPGRDYITSLLLSTSIQGNLVEPPTVPSLPLPLAGIPAPPAAHYLGDSAWLVIEFIYVLAERTCSLSSPPSCFSTCAQDLRCISLNSDTGH